MSAFTLNSPKHLRYIDDMKSEAETPRVSVVVPTYNRGWIVNEAIDSVLNQTFQQYELIVVDDGSTDDTKAILGEYGNRIRVIHQANRGVSAARNRGIRAAKEPLIAFLDSDDVWLSDKLSVQVAFFDRHPDALVCQTEEIWIRNGVRVNPGKRHRKRSGKIFEASLALCLVSPSAVMLRKDLFETIGLFDESLPACEDYDLWLRISVNHPIHLIDQPLIVKRGGHEDQLSRSWGLDRYRIESIAKLLERDVLSADQREAAVRMMRKKCAVYAGGCRKRGREEEARQYMKLADRYEKSGIK
jgi:glycosyltransferase involved in cell wall biosynthesis